MQGRTVILCASLLAVALLSSAAVAQTAAPAPVAPPKPVPVAEKPVDENGVPAWARRKRMYPVQSCETKPNIGGRDLATEVRLVGTPAAENPHAHLNLPLRTCPWRSTPRPATS